MKTVLAVLHAAFNKDRAAKFDAITPPGLSAQLQFQADERKIDFVVYRDHDGLGSLEPAKRLIAKACDHAEAKGATHVTFVPDDAVLCAYFLETLEICIEHFPEAILCFQSNHPLAADFFEKGHSWYTTPEGFTCFGGTMPVSWWREYLAWRETLSEFAQFDEGVNIWAMQTGRLIHKSLPSLMDHDLSLESLDGNVGPQLSPRKSVVFSPAVDLREHFKLAPKVFTFGRTYRGNHWSLVRKVKKYSEEDIERMYAVERMEPVSETPRLLVATPAYGFVDSQFLASRARVLHDLSSHGIHADELTSAGHSLVTRARHILMHLFLSSPCTGLFQWDADVECLYPSAIREMLLTGHDVIGGAYPFREKTLHVCAEQTDETKKTGKLAVRDHSCEVSHIGTGFLYVSRRAIVRLCAAHPELLYFGDIGSFEGAPFWALFDTALHNRRFLGEDWNFCRLWRELGEKVYCYVKPKFRHWGRMGFEGDIFQAWGAVDSASEDNKKENGRAIIDATASAS